MLEPPDIFLTIDRITAVLPLTVPRAEIQQVMGPGLNELYSVLAAQGITAAGPWFNHHLRMDPEVFDFEISLPVTKPVTAAGRVKPGLLRAARVARTVYSGGYEGLGEAWAEFLAWIETEGYKQGPDLWEVYLAGPESGADPSAWRTELNRPLIGTKGGKGRGLSNT